MIITEAALVGSQLVTRVMSGQTTEVGWRREASGGFPEVHGE